MRDENNSFLVCDVKIFQEKILKDFEQLLLFNFTYIHKLNINDIYILLIFLITLYYFKYII